MKDLVLLTLLATSTSARALDDWESVKEADLRETHTAAVRIVTTTEGEGAQIREGLPMILKYLAAIGVAPAGAPFTRYLEYTPEKVEIEIGFPVKGSIPEKDAIYSGSLPGGRVATLLYVGPYDQISPAYEGINEWMSVNRKKLRGKSWEIIPIDIDFLATCTLFTPAGLRSYHRP